MFTHTRLTQHIDYSHSTLKLHFVFFFFFYYYFSFPLKFLFALCFAVYSFLCALCTKNSRRLQLERSEFHRTHIVQEKKNEENCVMHMAAFAILMNGMVYAYVCSRIALLYGERGKFWSKIFKFTLGLSVCIKTICTSFRIRFGFSWYIRNSWVECILHTCWGGGVMIAWQTHYNNACNYAIM